MKRKVFILIFLMVILRGGIFAQQSIAKFLPDSMAINTVEKNGWEIIFQDEFEKDTLNTQKWWAQNSERKGELACFTSRPENVHVKNGILNIVVQKENYKQYAYTGGLLFASTPFNPNTYFETCIKFPKGKGFWPAFWFWSGSDSTYQEIDVVEYRGSKPTKFDISNHFWHSNLKKVDTDWIPFTAQTIKGKKVDLSEDFHIYAMEWLTDSIRIFMDNVLIKVYFKNIPQRPLNLILGMGLGGIDGKPNRRTKFPSTFAIDYVRVYKKNPTE